MLDSLGHFHDILQNFFGRDFLGLDVNRTSCDQQIPGQTQNECKNKLAWPAKAIELICGSLEAQTP